MGNQDTSYTVLAILEAKTGREDDLKSLLENVVEPSRSEKTCVDYRLHQSIQNSAQFFLYENWTSQKDHEAQFQKDYIKELSEKIGPILAKPYEVVLAKELCDFMSIPEPKKDFR